VMAVVLIVRPHGLLGSVAVTPRASTGTEAPLRPASPLFKAGAIAVLVALIGLAAAAKASPYALVLGTDVLIAVIFATSLHFIMGPGGLHSFGHAAYFGLGTYGAALLFKSAQAPMLVALAAAPVAALAGALPFGWFAVRLSGIYLAMLTLAFAQIVWSIVFQWQDVTGGSNGILGVWPTPPFEVSWSYYLLCVALTALVVVALRRALFSPFGYAMRAGRDSPLRAEAIGIDVKRVQWLAFALAGAAAGIAGGLFAFAKGSISPETIAVGRSIDAIVMVLLGGLEQLSGPIVGAGLFTVLQDTVMRQTDYWRALLGAIILVLVLVFPGGILGALSRLVAPRRTT
jgi:ABC-type branched-subunit amino acid transport system permease subunit